MRHKLEGLSIFVPLCGVLGVALTIWYSVCDEERFHHHIAYPIIAMKGDFSPAAVNVLYSGLLLFHIAFS